MVACQALEDRCIEMLDNDDEGLSKQTTEKLTEQLTHDCGVVQAYIGLLVENKIISANKVAIEELKELSN